MPYVPALPALVAAGVGKRGAGVGVYDAAVADERASLRRPGRSAASCCSGSVDGLRHCRLHCARRCAHGNCGVAVGNELAACHRYQTARAIEDLQPASENRRPLLGADEPGREGDPERAAVGLEASVARAAAETASSCRSSTRSKPAPYCGLVRKSSITCAGSASTPLTPVPGEQRRRSRNCGCRSMRRRRARSSPRKQRRFPGRRAPGSGICLRDSPTSIAASSR